MSKKQFYQIKVLTASLVVLLVLTPIVSAWGSITHANIMADVAEMPGAPWVMGRFIRNTAGGSVMVDWCCFIALYEKFVNQDGNAHNMWMVRHSMQHVDNFTLTMHNNANLPTEKAFAYGWITHWPSSDIVENEYKAIKKEQGAPLVGYLEVCVDILSHQTPRKANQFVVHPELIIETWKEMYPTSEYTPTHKDIQRGATYARTYMWIIPKIGETSERLNVSLLENISIFYGDYGDYYAKSVDFAYDNVTNPQALAKGEEILDTTNMPKIQNAAKGKEMNEEATRAVYETIEKLIDSQAIEVPQRHQPFTGTLYVNPLVTKDEAFVEEALEELVYELDSIFKY